MLMIPHLLNSQSVDLTCKLAAHLNDVSTAIVIGHTSSKVQVIRMLLRDITDRLNDTCVVPILTDVPRLDEIPHIPVKQVVAVGGGKILDCAKILSLSLSRTQLRARLSLGEFRIARKSRLICIPTTAGSGSEATHFCVCYVGDKKYSIAHPSIRPDVAILCPDLLLSLSLPQLAISALDAMAQAVESLFSKDATTASTEWARSALARGIPILRTMGRRKLNSIELAELQICANLSGRAIDIAKTNVPHALSYYLTARHGVPHGLAVGLFVEQYIRLINQERCHLTKIQVEDLTFICNLLGSTDVYCPGIWTTLHESFSLPRVLSELPAAVDKIALARSVNVQRMRNLAVPFNLDAFVECLFDATATAHS